MTGEQLWEAARDGDAAKVRTLLSTQGAQSFINYQGAHGSTRSTSRPNKGLRPLRSRSLLQAVASILKKRMGAQCLSYYR